MYIRFYAGASQSQGPWNRRSSTWGALRAGSHIYNSLVRIYIVHVNISISIYMFMCIQQHASQISTRNACQEHLPIWLKGADSSRSASFRDWTWSMWSCWRLSWWWLLLPVGEFGVPRAYYFGTHAKAIQTPVPSQGLDSSNAWNTLSEPTFGRCCHNFGLQIYSFSKSPPLF